MDEYKKNSKFGWIVFWIIILFASSCGELTNYDIEESKVLLYGFLNLLIVSAVMMMVPLLKYLNDGKKMPLKSGIELCKWNSIILFIISIIIKVCYGEGIVGGIGAIIYYYINKWLFVDYLDVLYNDLKGKKCQKCGGISRLDARYCTKCGDIFETEDISKCENCGALVASDAKECPKCGAEFEEEKENLFRCENCGYLVSGSETTCPNCGSEFEIEEEDDSSSVDKKYDDLVKLKKLLDKEIITKEEFEKEKKKILKN